MKKIKYITVLLFLSILCILPAHAENMDGGEFVPPEDTGTQFDEMYPDCKVNDYECIADHIEGIGSTTPQDFKSAIQSFDPDIASQEVNENYSANFQNSTMTAMTENLSLIKPHTYVMMISNFIIMIFETIGGALSLIALVAYNFLSGSAIESLISGTLENISNIIFNWKDTSSWIYNILFLIAFIGLVKKSVDLVTKRGGMPTTKNIVGIVMETIVSIAVVVFIGIYGRTLIHYVESTAESSIVSTFSFGSEEKPLEIAMKEQIFDIMQMKPFMMRHFGTSNINLLPMDEDVSYDDLLSFNTGRVQKILTDPSTSSARAEKNMGNGVIMQGIGTSFSCIGYSFLGLVHKILAGCVILALTLLLGAVRLLKEVLLFFSVLGLIVMLLNTSHPKVRNWFFNRLMWVIISILITILFTSFLFAWGQIMDSISGTGFIFTIVFDALLIFLLFLLWHFKDTLIEKFKDIVDTGGEIISGAFNGTLTPGQAFSMVQSTFTSDPDNQVGTANNTHQSKEGNHAPAMNDDLADDGHLNDASTDTNPDLSDDSNMPSFPNEIPIYSDEPLWHEDTNAEKADDSLPDEKHNSEAIESSKDKKKASQTSELERDKQKLMENPSADSSLDDSKELLKAQVNHHESETEDKRSDEDLLNIQEDLVEQVEESDIVDLEKKSLSDIDEADPDTKVSDDLQAMHDETLGDFTKEEDTGKNEQKQEVLDTTYKYQKLHHMCEQENPSVHGKELEEIQKNVSENLTHDSIEIQSNLLVNEINEDSLVEDDLEDMLEDLSDDAFIDDLDDYEEDTYSC